jgi:hypothetical protein
MGGVLQMNKYFLAINFSFFSTLLIGCVAGGSGVFLEAKKAEKSIDLRLMYTAYGGANLKMLKICEVTYDSKLNHKSSRVFATEILRKADRVEWIANIPTHSQADKIFVQSIFHTKDLIGWDTISDWVIKSNNLSSSYKNID